MSAPSADLAFVGGSVLTIDGDFSVAQAVAVAGGRIIAVGEEREVRELLTPRTRVVDLAGGALLPGINDSHLHGSMLGAFAPNFWIDSVAGHQPLPPARELSSEADREAALRRTWELLTPLGITSYTEPGLGTGADHQHGGSCGAAVLATYQRLAAANELPARVNVLALYGELDGMCDVAAFMDAVPGMQATPSDPDTLLRIAGVKLFADGIAPARTAWMSDPYPDGSFGALLIPGKDDRERVDAFETMVETAHTAGLQVGVHATGSGGVEMTANAFARAAARHGAADLRHYAIHGDCALPPALSTLARGGFGLNSQAAIADTLGELLDTALGAQAAARSFPLRTALEARVSLCLSSDSPALNPDWRRGVAAAVARRPRTDLTGALCDEHIELADALRAYTIVPAWQDHAEHFKGSIEVGKVADLCVLAQNPLAIHTDELPQVPVLMTVLGGDVIYEA